jgi:hypothetical protein
MRFTVTEIRHYYNNLELPEALWKWSRKHHRLETLSGHWVKLNRREDRISAEELRGYLVRYAPRHVARAVRSPISSIGYSVFHVGQFPSYRSTHSLR